MYVNDSKATNTDAVAKALESFDKPVILIMGGRGKGNGFHILKEPVRRHVKKLIAIGETKADIISVLGDECRDGSQAADSMEDAVLQAYRLAEPGDVVLLSPACSSFDMYRSYTERGDAFRQAVNALTWT